MSVGEQDPLLGRIALHYKVITPEQLAQAQEWQQRRAPNKRLSQVLVELRLCTQDQMQKLLQVQEQQLAKRRGDSASAAPQTAPAPPAVQGTRSQSHSQPTIPAAQTAPQRPSHSTPRGEPPPAARPGPSTSRPEPAPAAAPRSSSASVHAEPAPPPRLPPQAPATMAATIAPSAKEYAGLKVDPRNLLPKMRHSGKETRFDKYLRHAVQIGASDVHIHSGAPLKMRVLGRMTNLDDTVLSGEEVETMLREALPADVLKTLDELGEADFAYNTPSGGRFRANVYREQRGMDCTLRLVPAQPPTLEALNLPPILAKLTSHHQGLVLLTGPGGCGKSSTLAALIDIVNTERPDHILTIEDPIECLHPSKLAVVNQRQVGRHTGSFARALRAALREDPDVIAIGELRDLETISLALSAAETGHLVVGTLHTSGAIRTIDRLIGVFPPSQQSQVRTMLSESLRGIVSQRLVPRADGQGRVPALEILLASRAVANLIRENKAFQIRDVLVTGATQGMCLLDNSLQELVRAGIVRREDAARFSDDPKRFGG